ncbi:MAG TPA: hypothetical protein VD931_20305, partial [Baekduia sp.]|nr:hypothetical protein [Baekduia sp.]
LPSREVLYAQLVQVVAAPLTGLARSLNGIVGGLAYALADLQKKKESGEVPAGDAPAAAAEPAPAAEAAPAEDTDSTDQDAEAPEPAASPEEPAEGAEDKPETQED